MPGVFSFRTGRNSKELLDVIKTHRLRPPTPGNPMHDFVLRKTFRNLGVIHEYS